jgi:hypothetical protein
MFETWSTSSQSGYRFKQIVNLIDGENAARSFSTYFTISRSQVTTPGAPQLARRKLFIFSLRAKVSIEATRASYAAHSLTCTYTPT